MLTDEERAALEAAWAPARAAGILGTASVEALWEHTAGFVSAVCSSFSAPPESLELDLIDVGTGAGVPGLLLAHALPGCRVTLVDGSDRRLDHVRRAARALGLSGQVEVVHGDAEVLGRNPALRGHFDVAVARLLAEPAEALELLVPLVCDGGVLIVSTAEVSRSQWAQLPVPDCPTGPAVLAEHGGSWFVMVERRGDLPRLLPRRRSARRRRPLLTS